MPRPPYVAGRAARADAYLLLGALGDAAVDEAATRADRSRDIGNHLHFCHWRQIERLLGWLSSEHAIGTIH